MNIKRTFIFASRIAIYRFKNPELPWRINLSITHLCNSKCKMCGVWKIYRENSELLQQEMKLEHFNKLFSEMGDYLLWLHLTGGEPFLRRDLIEILKIAVENCKNLTIIDTSTNGFATNLIKSSVEQIAQLLQERKIIFSIGISIDGPPEIHNNMRGIENAWNLAINTLKTLKELEKSYSNLKVHINYTITSYNAGYLAETYNILQRIVDLSPHDISISIEHSGLQFQNLNKHIDYATIKNKIEKDLYWILENSRNDNSLKDLVKWVRNKFKRAFTKFAIKYINEPSKMILQCEALRSSVYIDPYGNVYPCTIWNVKLGNIKEKSLREIIYNDIAQKIRKLIIEGKCPNCWSGCESWPTMLIRYWKAFYK